MMFPALPAQHAWFQALVYQSMVAFLPNGTCPPDRPVVSKLEVALLMPGPLQLPMPVRHGPPLSWLLPGRGHSRIS
jgi:hypothetical protein